VLNPSVVHWPKEDAKRTGWLAEARVSTQLTVNSTSQKLCSRLELGLFLRHGENAFKHHLELGVDTSR